MFCPETRPYIQISSGLTKRLAGLGTTLIISTFVVDAGSRLHVPYIEAQVMLEN